jgi:rRNA maturation protein Nop10
MEESQREACDDLMESTQKCPQCRVWMLRSGLGDEGSVASLCDGHHVLTVLLHSCPQCGRIALESVP